METFQIDFGSFAYSSHKKRRQARLHKGKAGAGKKGSYSPWQDMNLPLFEDALGEKARTILLWSPEDGLEKDNQPNPYHSNMLILSS